MANGGSQGVILPRGFKSAVSDRGTGAPPVQFKSTPAGHGRAPVPGLL